MAHHLPVTARLKKEGAHVENVRVADLQGKDGGTGWGLITSKPLTKDQQVIHLPAELHLTYDADTTDPKLMKLIDQ